MSEFAVRVLMVLRCASCDATAETTDPRIPPACPSCATPWRVGGRTVNVAYRQEVECRCAACGQRSRTPARQPAHTECPSCGAAWLTARPWIAA